MATAGGPIFPRSAIPMSAHVYWNVHVGAGGVSAHEEGMGLTDATTMTANAIWRLRFSLPPGLPTGQMKLRLMSLAAATTGIVDWDAQWKQTAAEEDPSTGALNAEGDVTITWGAGDSDQYKETKVDLNAVTPLASREVVMDLVFKDSTTTLAVVSTHIVSIIWE
jgi:hypothetical protein